MALIEWDDSLKLGIAVVDRQHERLVGIINRLHQEIVRIAALPEVRSQLGALGFEVVDYGPEQFTAYVRSEMARWSKVFNEIGIKPADIEWAIDQDGEINLLQIRPVTTT